MAHPELVAVRHPKRGKAHRQLGRWQTTACRPDSSSGMGLFETLTERIPLAQTAPEDRCKRCWPADSAPAERPTGGDS